MTCVLFLQGASVPCAMVISVLWMRPTLSPGKTAHNTAHPWSQLPFSWPCASTQMLHSSLDPTLNKQAPFSEHQVPQRVKHSHLTETALHSADSSEEKTIIPCLLNRCFWKENLEVEEMLLNRDVNCTSSRKIGKVNSRLLTLCTWDRVG